MEIYSKEKFSKKKKTAITLIFLSGLVKCRVLSPYYFIGEWKTDK